MEITSEDVKVANEDESFYNFTVRIFGVEPVGCYFDTCDQEDAIKQAVAWAFNLGYGFGKEGKA